MSKLFLAAAIWLATMLSVSAQGVTQIDCKNILRNADGSIGIQGVVKVNGLQIGDMSIGKGAPMKGRDGTDVDVYEALDKACPAPRR